MEEKKSKLSIAVVLLILAIIVIVVMAVFVYKLYIDNKERENTIDALHTDVDNMVKGLADKNTEIYDLTEQIENLNKEVEENLVEQENTMSESEALELIEEKYEEAKKLYFGQVGYDINDTIEDGLYCKVNNSNIIKEAFSKNGLFQYLETNAYVKEYNGEYYRVAADRGGDGRYKGNEFKIISINEYKIIAISTEKYNRTMNSNDTDTAEIENIFIIVNEEGKWRIESYTLPY